MSSFGKFLHAGEIDAGDAGPLFDGHHQHLIVGFQADILEKAGGIERLDRFRCARRGQCLADLDRQIAEHRAGLGALNAFHPNILDLKWIEGMRLAMTTEPGQAWREKADEGEKKTWGRLPDEESLQVVEKCEEHQHAKQADADALADFLNPLGDRFSGQKFDEIIQQVSAIQ
jgi:hypothetical protein